MNEGLTQQIQQATPQGYWITVIALLVIIGVALWGTFRFLRRARIIEDTPTSLIRSAAQGYVELDGLQELMEGQPIVSPLTGTRCTWYRFEVEEKRVRHTSKGRETRWVTIEKGTSDGLFLVKDETGQAAIDPDGAEVTCNFKDQWYGHSRRPTGPPASGGSFISMNTGKYRYTERRMLPGEPLYAIGFFKTVGGAGDLGSSADDIRQLLREWKADPSRMAHFDSDGDGNIDAHEWEAARAAARREVLQSRAERSASAGTNVMCKPDDSRLPYLLSTQPQTGLASRYRWYSRGSLAGLILSAGVLLFIMQARLTG